MEGKPGLGFLCPWCYPGNTIACLKNPHSILKLCVRVCTRASVGAFPYSSLRKSKLAIYSNVLSQVPSEWLTSHDPCVSPLQ